MSLPLLHAGPAVSTFAFAVAALSCLPAQDFTLVGPTTPEPRFDASSTADWLAKAARSQRDTERPVATTGWIVLALLANGSTMRTGPHREQLKLEMVFLRTSMDDQGRFAPGGVPCGRMDQLVATLAVQRTFVLSNYQLLRPIAVKGAQAVETSFRAPNAPAATVEEAALLAHLASTFLEAEQKAERARLETLAKEALARHKFGRERRGDAALHLGQLLLGEAHPPELTVARCWPANLTVDPLHTLFGVLALQRADGKVQTAQIDLLHGLLAARLDEGADAGSWAAAAGHDAATTSAMLVVAIGHANTMASALAAAAPKNK